MTAKTNGTDARQNCTLLLHTCNPSLKPDAQFGVRTRQSIQLVQCHVIQSVETTCSSFKKLQSCVNNTLLPNYCEDDPVISSQISNLRQSYSDPCSTDTMCAIELVKCACTADILNSASMCKSIDIYKNCAGKIKDCDKSTQVWQSLSITFKMSEGACNTECPSAFTCWMYAEDQVDFLFARLHSSVEISKSQTCRSLATRFQCLLKNTSYAVPASVFSGSGLKKATKQYAQSFSQTQQTLLPVQVSGLVFTKLNWYRRSALMTSSRWSLF
ncbi:uncharacterized protein LOC112558826 [Pomacea canaliculata]|uniref:uncharacterized protein LOC112558826 n=1 Tax=Pomacea canaliculata TaxID=400727 RepID=UPI000D73BEC9|nr:uncharacterized protein LOC112558826 [Pomacea canaliculata]